MDVDKIKERLELALRPAEQPSIEEVLERVSIHGALQGPADWVFPTWMSNTQCRRSPRCFSSRRRRRDSCFTSGMQ